MKIVEIIKNRLESEITKLNNNFNNSNKDFGCRYCCIDNFLPEDVVNIISNKFPSYKSMRFLNSHREQKYTSKQFSQFDPIISEVAFSLQHPEVIKIIEKITGIKNQMGDPSFYAGGVSAMLYDNFLNPHLDNSHNYNLDAYRTLNLLFYITPDWKYEDGGHLELWDTRVKKNKVIESKFNRLVLMETNQISWHSVCKVKKKGLARNCISNYYFSKNSPTGNNYANVTEFNGRPDQKIRRFICLIDNYVRNFIRKVNKKGFSKVDLNN